MSTVCKEAWIDGWRSPDREREALLERHRDIFERLAGETFPPTIAELTVELEEIERLIALVPTPQS